MACDETASGSRSSPRSRSERQRNSRNSAIEHRCNILSSFRQPGLSEIHRNVISLVVQVDGKTQTIVSTCGKTAARARFRNLWQFVQITAGGSNTIPTREHLNLEKLTALAWNMSPRSGRPLAKQEVLVRQHSDHKRKRLTHQNAIKNLAI